MVSWQMDTVDQTLQDHEESHLCISVNTPLRKEEEIIRVHVSNMNHMSTDELKRKLREKE